MLSNCQRDQWMGISSAEAQNAFTNSEPQVVEFAVIRRCSGSIVLPSHQKPDWLPQAGGKQLGIKNEPAMGQKPAARKGDITSRPNIGPMPLHPAPLQAQKAHGTRRAA